MVPVRGNDPRTLALSRRCSTTELNRHLVEAVRFELTDPFGSSVFKTGAFSQALPHFLILWYPCPESNREIVTPFERAAFTYLATGALECRAGVEPAVLRFCRPLHWASLPPTHIWRPARDSNPVQRFWRPLCCR